MQSRSSNLYGLAMPSPPRHAARHKLGRVVADLEQKLASYLDIDRYFHYAVTVPAPSTVNTTPVTPRIPSPGYMSFGSRASRVMRLQPSASTVALAPVPVVRQAPAVRPRHCQASAQQGHWEVDEPVRQWERAPEETQRGHTVGSIPS